MYVWIDVLFVVGFVCCMCACTYVCEKKLESKKCKKEQNWSKKRKNWRKNGKKMEIEILVCMCIKIVQKRTKLEQKKSKNWREKTSKNGEKMEKKRK